MRFLIGFINCVNKLNDWVGKVFGFLVYPIMIVLVFEVVMRYAFNRPTIWAHESSCMLYGAHFLLGGAYALSKDAFVNVEVFYQSFRPRVRAIIDLFTWTLFYAFVGTLFWKSIPWAYLSLRLGEYSESVWGPPLWPIKLVVPLSAFLMLLQGTTKTIKDLYLALTGRELVTVAEDKAIADE